MSEKISSWEAAGVQSFSYCYHRSSSHERWNTFVCDLFYKNYLSRFKNESDVSKFWKISNMVSYSFIVNYVYVQIYILEKKTVYFLFIIHLFI